jgi:hypothetical protein
MKKYLLALLAATALSTQVQAHTVALGWNVLANGDVEFFDAHWHGSLSTPNGSLFIDGNEHPFTGVVNNINSYSGLEGALINSTYYSWDGTSVLTSIGSYNDWLTVTVSGLTAGAHTFATTNIALTQWTLDNNQSSVVVTLPPPTSAVPIPAAAFLFGPAVLGFMGLRRKAKKLAV